MTDRRQENPIPVHATPGEKSPGVAAPSPRLPDVPAAARTGAVAGRTSPAPNRKRRGPTSAVPKAPAYRQRSGYDQAIVTLTDSATGKRRDYWLGTYGTAESREMYHRLLAEWETNGRRLPDRPGDAATPNDRKAGITVADLIAQHWKFAKGYYSGPAVHNIRAALRVLRQCYGSADAGTFGPNALRIVRDSMVTGREGPDVKKPRAPWCRSTVNTRVGYIVRMFKWGASRELLRRLSSICTGASMRLIEPTCNA